MDRKLRQNCSDSDFSAVLKHKFYSYDSVTEALLLYNYNYHSEHYLSNILINYVISLAKFLYILFRLIEPFFLLGVKTFIFCKKYVFSYELVFI